MRSSVGRESRKVVVENVGGGVFGVPGASGPRISRTQVTGRIIFEFAQGFHGLDLALPRTRRSLWRHQHPLEGERIPAAVRGLHPFKHGILENRSTNRSGQAPAAVSSTVPKRTPASARLEAHLAGSLRGAAYMHLPANARPLEIALGNIAGEGVGSPGIHQSQGAPSESAAHHSRSVDSLHGGSRIHHNVQFFTTHLVIVAEADVRSFHPFSQLSEIAALQSLGGG